MKTASLKNTCPELHGCYLTASGTLHTIVIPKFVEQRLSRGEPVPSSFMYEIKVQDYMLAPAYQAYLIRTYGEKAGTAIYQKLERFLEMARIYKIDPALHQKKDSQYILDLGD